MIDKVEELIEVTALGVEIVGILVMVVGTALALGQVCI